MFGWALYESVERYPKVLSSAEIERRLKIGNNSALMLKRRLQLLASDQIPRIKELMKEELANRFEGVELPPVAAGKNVNEVLAGRPVPHVDTCVLFSASQRANKGRARHKHTGMTASIYLSDKLGGKQIGSLIHTFGWKGGPVIYDTINNNKAESIRPLLDAYLPEHTPVFSDEAYKWYYRVNRGHRMINHSRKSPDPRHKWSRERWSKDGINSQVAEGNQRTMKYNMIAGYGYFKPEYAPLYLNEFSFWKCVKYYGWEKLIRSDEEYKLEAEKRKIRVAPQNINKIEKETVEEKAHEPRPEALVCNEKTGKGKEVKAGFEGSARAKKRGLRGDDLTGAGAGEGPGFSRICIAKAEPGKMPGSPPPEGGLRFRRGKCAEAGWLKETIKILRFQPLSLEERKIIDKSNSHETQKINFDEFPRLARMMDDAKRFKQKPKQHEHEQQRRLEFQAARLWEFLSDDEYQDIDTLIHLTGVERSSAYRAIRIWALAGVAEVIDRTRRTGVKDRISYDVRSKLPQLPTLRYALSRNEFVNFETKYRQFIEAAYGPSKLSAFAEVGTYG